MEFNPIYEKLFLQAKKKTGQKEFSEPNVFMPAPTPPQSLESYLDPTRSEYKEFQAPTVLMPAPTPPQGLESYPYLRKAYMETTTPSNFGY